jgi:predicted nucleotidyltransferase
MDDTLPSTPDAALVRALRDHFAGTRPDGMVSARLFGSEARGDRHRDSDVDIAILLDHERYPTRLERSEAGVGLGSELIGATHRNDVDAVILNDAPPLLARHAIESGAELYVSDPGADFDFRLQVLLRAADLEPWLRRMSALKLDALTR